MRLGVEEADRAQDAVIGFDQVVALEARQFAEAGNEAALSLLDELVCALLIDRVVASNGGMHVMLPSVSSGRDDSVESSRGARALGDVEGSL
jgi:hypothetical protein